MPSNRSKYSQEMREETAKFISDMYKNYKDIHKFFFKNAKFVVNKYYYVRQTTFAFKRIRKEIQ